MICDLLLSNNHVNPLKIIDAERVVGLGIPCRLYWHFKNSFFMNNICNTAVLRRCLREQKGAPLVASM